jgi:hypothetical protein
VNLKPWCAAVAAMLLVGALSGCDSEEPAPPSTSPAISTGAGGSVEPSAGGTGGPSDPTQVQALLALAERPVLASATAKIGRGAKKEWVAEVLEVQAGETDTFLRWRLRPADGSNIAPDTQLFGRPGMSLDTAGVTIADPAGDVRVFPFSFSPTGSVQCACADIGINGGRDGFEFTALMPAVSATATEVRVEVPGFKAMTVPVARS